ncbi:MAG: hypothetical protein AAFY63_05580 [Cyanobacteria bacterium J06643_13]
MNHQIKFIAKILLLSTGLSLLIKYGGKYLPLQPTNVTALAIVLMPSLIIGFVLGWQYSRL